MAIASDILVMNKGKIEQEGTPLEIFDQPRTGVCRAIRWRK